MKVHRWLTCGIGIGAHKSRNRKDIEWGKYTNSNSSFRWLGAHLELREGSVVRDLPPSLRRPVAWSLPVVINDNNIPP